MYYPMPLYNNSDMAGTTNSIKNTENFYLISSLLYKILTLFLGGLRVTNPPIGLMCPPSVCPSVRPLLWFPDSNSKTVCPIEVKLGREIDHHYI